MNSCVRAHKIIHALNIVSEFQQWHNIGMFTCHLSGNGIEEKKKSSLNKWTLHTHTHTQITKMYQMLFRTLTLF